MRFNNVLVAFASVVGVISAFQDVNVRTLAKAPSSKTNGVYELNENQWVTANKVKSGDKVSAVQLTGCTAVFLWDKDNIPSVYHIFCGDEEADGKTAAEDVAELPMAKHPVAVTLAAGYQKHWMDAKAAIQKEFPNLTDAKFKEHKILYDLKKLAAGEAYRFDAVAGTLKVTQRTEKKVSQQPQGFRRF